MDDSEDNVLENVVSKPEDIPKDSWEFRIRMMKEW